MSDKKISQLDATNALQAIDEIALARSGQNFKVTAADAIKFFGIKIQTTPVSYIPSATNNPDSNKIAKGSNGFWYLFDSVGGAIKIIDLLEGYDNSPDANYVHTQGVSSATWSVQHNLGKYPCVRVVDSAGTSVPIVQIEDVDVNNIIVHLAFAASGKVYCN